MEERIARLYEQELARPDISDPDESPAETASQSEVNPESEPNVETWSDGFVKPDGTHVQLFIPRATAA